MASYGWTHVLTEEVPNAETVDVPAPGVGNPDCDHDNMELAVDGVEVDLDDFTADEDVDNNTVTVTNDTGNTWPEGATLYVYAPGKTAAAGLVQLAAQVADHETRIAALEGVAGDEEEPAGRKSKGRK
jgi:hypothetical protein